MTIRNTQEMFEEGVANKGAGHRCFEKFLHCDINLQSERCDEPGLRCIGGCGLSGQESNYACICSKVWRSQSSIIQVFKAIRQGKVAR
ncbi:hypothetical protein Y032_0015g2552 [Ancylostoma ceylanicum]|uniref:Uncharacterized protein n=1 Tax=Ancylostoma ceylanicum TaxID=53326 RepID=A0A016V947_9BILA|nr:hypothetical protein Y032_0015g2552 [Ancylostoma ceylanicum]